MSEVTHRSVVSQVLEARSVSTPLIAIETPDPGATTSELVKAIEVTCQKAEAPIPPIFNWDSASWLRAVNSTACRTCIGFGKVNILIFRSCKPCGIFETSSSPVDGRWW
jgi:hypothetical protein